MSSFYHGGQAFPFVPPCDDRGVPATGYGSFEYGMNMRQYFAAAALTGMLSNPNGAVMANWTPEMIAEHASKIADAMILEVCR